MMDQNTPHWLVHVCIQRALTRRRRHVSEPVPGSGAVTKRNTPQLRPQVGRDSTDRAVAKAGARRGRAFWPGAVGRGPGKLQTNLEFRSLEGAREEKEQRLNSNTLPALMHFPFYVWTRAQRGEDDPVKVIELEGSRSRLKCNFPGPSKGPKWNRDGGCWGGQQGSTSGKEPTLTGRTAAWLPRCQVRVMASLQHEREVSVAWTLEPDAWWGISIPPHTHQLCDVGPVTQLL